MREVFHKIMSGTTPVKEQKLALQLISELSQDYQIQDIDEFISRVEIYIDCLKNLNLGSLATETGGDEFKVLLPINTFYNQNK